jgi:phage host-nuclease inhibitor protein Gam
MKVNSPFVQKTNHLAAKLKVWCRKKKPLQVELKSLEQEIKQIQKQPIDQQDHAREAAMVQRYVQTITKVNDSYVQRAKKNWVKDGNRNTAYFHRSIAKRRRRNTIVSIKDEQNVTLYAT